MAAAGLTEGSLFSKQLFAENPIPMWVYEIETLKILTVNNAAVAQYGYSPDEFVTLTLKDIRPSGDIPRLLESVANVSHGLDEPGVYRHLTKSGETIYAEISTHTIHYDGRLCELVTARNVTSWVQTRNDLLARDRLLESAQRIGNMGSWELSLLDNTLVWSEQTFSIFGIPDEAPTITPERFLDLVHLDSRDALAEAQEEALRKDQLLDIEYRIITPHDEVRYLHGRGEVLRLVDGTPTHIVGMVMDITDRKTTEMRLKRSKQLLKAAGRTAQFGGWSIDMVNEKVAWSDEVADIYELPRGAQPAFEEPLRHYVPEHQPRVIEVVNNCLEDGTPFDEEFEIHTLSNKRLWVRTTGEPLVDDAGKVIGVQGAFQNIDQLKRAERRSQELAERLTRVLESITDAFITFDNDWCFTFVNSEAERLLRRCSDDLLGKSVWEEFPEAVGSQFEAEYRRALKEGVTVVFETYFAPLEAWFHVRAYPSSEGLAVYFQDTTDARAKQEQRLLLEAAIAQINDLVFITDVEVVGDDGPRIIYVNEAFERHTGYSKEEIIGQTPKVLHGLKSDHSELVRIANALQRGDPVRAELINYKKDGSEFWVEIEIAPVTDEDGIPSHCVAVLRDITRRKRAIEELRQSEERFQIVAKATADTIWDWDLLTDTIWWSDGLQSNYGHIGDQVDHTSESKFSRVHRDERFRVVRSCMDVARSKKERWQEEYHFERADGSFAIIEDKGFVIRDDSDAAVRMVGSMTDITEKRQMQATLEQTQRMEAVGQLTGGIAHDFNNLLTVIVGNSELLMEELEETLPNLYGYAKMSRRAAERGSDLVRQLLAFSRKQALEPELTDVGRTLEGMKGIIQSSIKEQVSFRLTIEPDLAPVLIDEAQLESAILNLCINARDAMPKGGRLEIAASAVSLGDGDCGDLPEGAYVGISVKDTGTGMTPETARKVFEPFFTTKEVGHGTGLGLSMVFGFVKQSGGNIVLNSAVGEGTTFTLYFPAADGELSGATAQNTDTVIEGTGTVLVVEDNEMVLHSARHHLEALGYQTLIAEHGQGALKVLQECRPGEVDLLFTDLVMPGAMNGMELAERAKEMHPDLKVLITTGYQKDILTKAPKTGSKPPVLLKPYNREAMASAIRDVLDEPVTEDVTYS